MDLAFNFGERFEKVDNYKFKKIGFGAGLAFILLVGLIVGYSQSQVGEAGEVYSTYAMVNSSDSQGVTAGIDTGSGLAFGQMVEGTNMTKTLEFSSDKLTLAELSSKGNISEGLMYEDQLFVNETSIDLKYVGSEPGYYEGEVLLDLKTAQNSWGEKWLELVYRLP